MTNIIFLTKNFNLIGGVEKFISTFYHNVNGQDYNVEVWCKIKHDVDLGIPCIQFKDQDLIEEKLASFNVNDTVFISINEAFGDVYDKIKDYKMILAVRGQYSYLLNKNEFKQQFKYNKIVTLTDIDELMFKFTGNRDVTTISNYVDTQEENFADINGPITMVGRLSIEKNFRHLLEIAPLINSKITAYISVLEFAKEELKQINAEIIKRGLEDKLEFIVGETDKDKMYKGKSIVLNLSSIESFGNTILEGMSYGLPVIGYDVTPGVEFLVKDNGYKVKYEDYEGVAKKINQLTSNVELFNAISEKSYLRANTFTKEITIKSWLETIDEVFSLDKKQLTYPNINVAKKAENRIISRIKPKVIVVTNKAISPALNNFYQVFKVSNLEMLKKELFINNRYFKENYYEIQYAFIDVDYNILANIIELNEIKRILSKYNIARMDIKNPDKIGKNDILYLERKRNTKQCNVEAYIKIPQNCNENIELQSDLNKIKNIYPIINDYNQMKYFKPVVEITEEQFKAHANCSFIIDRIMNNDYTVVGPTKKPTVKPIKKQPKRLQFVKPKEKLLILTGLFPDENNAYANQFVYTRAKAYMANCHVDIGVTNKTIEANTKPVDRVYNGIKVYEYNTKALINLIEKNKYTKIVVHFNNPLFYNVIENFPNISKFIWVHGGDCQTLQRRPYNLEKITYLKEYENKKQLATMANTAFLPNVQFVFPSNWLKNVFMQDVLKNTGEINYKINSNLIDTETFKYVDRDFSKLKILVVKSYVSNVYATDIVQQVITSLNKYKIFDEIEFTVIGKGKLWEENTRKLADFENVKLINEFFDHDELPSFYHDNNILLAPTRTDSQGVSRLEAMATGMITLSTNIAAIKEFISPGSVVIKNNVAEEFVEAILNLAELNQESLKEMSKQNSEYVQNELNYNKILSEDINILEI